jgi:hypothetical protein
MHSSLPYGQIGRNGTDNTSVTLMKSNVTPGTTQQWQQLVPPQKYEGLAQKQ